MSNNLQQISAKDINGFVDGIKPEAIQIPQRIQVPQKAWTVEFTEDDLDRVFADIDVLIVDE